MSFLCSSFEDHLDDFCVWAFEHNVLEKRYDCHICGGSVSINFTKYKKMKHGFIYECLTNSNHRITLFHSSIFHNSNLSFSNIIFLMYAFIYEFQYNDIQRETLSEVMISSATISKYFKLFRELIFGLVEDIKNENGFIGGEGKIVEVDECLIGHRKYNRGRFKISSWIVGIVERNSGKVRFESIESRDHETLFNFLKKHVHPKSTVITDCWRGYIGIDSYFERHQTVNHSKNFRDPITGAYTQTFESQWRLLENKVLVPHMNDRKRDENLSLSLCEHIYRQNYRKLDRNLFATKFISDICSKYREFI